MKNKIKLSKCKNKTVRNNKFLSNNETEDFSFNEKENIGFNVKNNLLIKKETENGNTYFDVDLNSISMLKKIRNEIRSKNKDKLKSISEDKYYSTIKSQISLKTNKMLTNTNNSVGKEEIKEKEKEKSPMNVTLKDLCVDDKKKIGELVNKLAKEKQEKDDLISINIKLKEEIIKIDEIINRNQTLNNILLKDNKADKIDKVEIKNTSSSSDNNENSESNNIHNKSKNQNVINQLANELDFKVRLDDDLNKNEVSFGKNIISIKNNNEPNFKLVKEGFDSIYKRLNDSKVDLEKSFCNNANNNFSFNSNNNEILNSSTFRLDTNSTIFNQDVNSNSNLNASENPENISLIHSNNNYNINNNEKYIESKVNEKKRVLIQKDSNIKRMNSIDKFANTLKSFNSVITTANDKKEKSLNCNSSEISINSKNVINNTKRILLSSRSKIYENSNKLNESCLEFSKNESNLENIKALYDLSSNKENKDNFNNDNKEVVRNQNVNLVNNNDKFDKNTNSDVFKTSEKLTYNHNNIKELNEYINFTRKIDNLKEKIKNQKELDEEHELMNFKLSNSLNKNNLINNNKENNNSTKKIIFNTYDSKYDRINCNNNIEFSNYNNKCNKEYHYEEKISKNFCDETLYKEKEYDHNLKYNYKCNNIRNEIEINEFNNSNNLFSDRTEMHFNLNHFSKHSDCSEKNIEQDEIISILNESFKLNDLVKEESKFHSKICSNNNEYKPLSENINIHDLCKRHKDYKLDDRNNHNNDNINANIIDIINELEDSNFFQL